MSANNLKEISIVFPNQNRATAIFPTAQSKMEEVVAALALNPYSAAILVIGGADGLAEKAIPRLKQMFGRGIARAAVEAKAVIIDGGTQAGVMAMMGEGVESRGYKSQLVGVAPAALVSYPGGPTEGTPLEPNHSHFVLAEGNTWGSETGTMFNLLKVLVADKVPAVAILAGGGDNTLKEVLSVVRQNLPLIVVEGSGGLADQIAAAWAQRATQPDNPDPVMAEIIADGDIHLHRLDNPVKGIERLIVRELGGDNVLLQAWETFADYDLNANFQQRRFNWLQLAILAMGLLATALAIIKQVRWAKTPDDPQPIEYRLLKHTLILIPVAMTILVTAAGRFKQGNKWLLLRAGAESIKREIYRYRSRAMYYKENPEQQLSQKVEDITRRTMRTDVNATALRRYDKDKGFPPYMYAAQGGDDGFSYLTPDRYIQVRLGDQVNYFQKRTLRLEKQIKLLYWLTFIVGGVGTYLAAIDLAVWVALTTATVAAIGTYLAYKQTENTLTKYNQAATDLTNVKAWWIALPAEEQSKQDNIDLLVEHTEQVLQSELDGWVQQMQNALDALRKDQEDKVSPKVSGITPDAGPTAGGKAVTISGINFLNGATVKLGGTDATGVTVMNSTTITAATPAHAAGVVDVVVTNPDTLSATLRDGFTYKDPTPGPPPPPPPPPAPPDHQGGNGGGQGDDKPGPDANPPAQPAADKPPAGGAGDATSQAGPDAASGQSPDEAGDAEPDDQTDVDTGTDQPANQEGTGK